MGEGGESGRERRPRGYANEETKQTRSIIGNAMVTKINYENRLLTRRSESRSEGVEEAGGKGARR